MDLFLFICEKPKGSNHCNKDVYNSTVPLHSTFNALFQQCGGNPHYKMKFLQCAQYTSPQSRTDLLCCILPSMHVGNYQTVMVGLKPFHMKLSRTRETADIGNMGLTERSQLAPASG